MANYIYLFNFTEQGLKTYKDSPKRADVSAGLVEKLGGRVKSVYWTTGPYDGVIIAELPNDEAAASFSLATCAMGNVRTFTLRAFDREEFTKIVGKIG